MEDRLGGFVLRANGDPADACTPVTCRGSRLDGDVQGSRLRHVEGVARDHVELRPTGLSGAIYGVILLLVIYVMPSGAAGFVRLLAAQWAKSRQHRVNRSERRSP